MTNVKSRFFPGLEATQEYNFSKGFLSFPGPAQLLQKVTWNSQLQNPAKKKKKQQQWILSYKQNVSSQSFTYCSTCISNMSGASSILIFSLN